MKDFKFNASEVVCNGIVGGAKELLTQRNYQTLSAFLKTHFMMASKKQILEELQDSEQLQDNWYIGSRVENNDAILTRMVGGLWDYSINMFEGEKHLAEMWMNAQVNNMTARDIITVLESALMDCATADHWYAFEKEY